MKKVDFKLNNNYSSNYIFSNLDNYVASGEVIGGVHTIENEYYRFVMLSEGAWRGGSSYFYRLVEVK
jgi:hypothetical protein